MSLPFDDRKSCRESELDAELQAYLEMLTEEKIRRGLSPAEARRAALIEIGGVEQIKEECRDVQRPRWLENIRRDIGYAIRMLGKSRGFAGATILILSLAIGANTAAFSLIDAVAFRSLPVRSPGELVWFDKPSFSYPIFQETHERREDIFSGLFGWTIESMSIDWDNQVENAQVLLTTPEFYSTLGITAAHGRTLSGGDEGSTSAVISFRTWRSRFASDPNVLGRTVRIDRVPFTIVGVAPEGFFGVAPGAAPEVTIPVTAIALLRPAEKSLTQPAMAWLHMMARLKPGVSREKANAALQVFWRQVMEQVTPSSIPASRRKMFLDRTTALMPGHAGFSRIARQFSKPLMLLLGFCALLLLAVCATLTNLMLVRTSARRREISVRLAIGASRRRVIGQLITEAMVLTSLGVIGALLVANLGGSLLVQLIATSSQPVQVDLSLDWRVLTFTLALWLLTLLTAVLAPVLRATAVDPGTALKESARTLGSFRWRTGKILVIAQVALAVLMVGGAALFGRSLGRLLTLDPGFSHRNVLLVQFEPLLAGYGGEKLMDFYRTLQQRLAAVPGIESAALSWAPPVSNTMGSWTQSIGVDGPPPETPGAEQTYINVASADYFSTIGQRLLRGRDFGPQDTPDGPRVCIITESLARTYLPRQNPIGHRLSIGRDPARDQMTIIGVVEDAKYLRLQEPVTRTAYLLYSQSGDFLNSSNLMAEVRTSVNPGSLTSAIRREIHAIDPTLPVRFEALSDRVRESLVVERVVAVISAFLGSVALVLACAGLYGLLAYTVGRRTAEIGLRIALGSRRGSVQWLVLKECLALAVVGVSAGLATALILGRFAEKLLFEIKPTDPLALGWTAALMLSVAILAAFLPARRAASIDPAAALRHD